MLHHMLRLFATMTIEGAIAVTQNHHRILLTSVRSCEGYVDSAVQGTCKHRMEHINTHIFSVLAVDTDDAITRSYMRVCIVCFVMANEMHIDQVLHPNHLMRRRVTYNQADVAPNRTTSRSFVRSRRWRRMSHYV